MEDALYREALQVLGVERLPAPLAWAFRAVVGLRGLGDLHDTMCALPSDRSYYARLREALQIDLDVRGSEHIPRTGAAVVVGNHPYGLLEGVILGNLFPPVRPDWKVMTTGLMAGFPEIRHQYILVDPFQTAAARRANLQGLRESLEHLRRGGLLTIFPAGAVAHLRWGRWAVEDSPWVPSMARVIRSSRAAVVPLRIEGRNSWRFQLLGLLHPLVRTALLGRELLNKKGRRVVVRVGEAIPTDAIAGYPDDAALMAFLRSQVERL